MINKENLAQTTSADSPQVQDSRLQILFEKHYGIMLETILARRQGVTPGAIATARNKFWANCLNAENYVLVRRFWKSMKQIQEYGLDALPGEIQSRLTDEERRITHKVFARWQEDRHFFIAMPDVSEAYRNGSLNTGEYIRRFLSRGGNEQA